MNNKLFFIILFIINAVFNYFNTNRVIVDNMYKNQELKILYLNDMKKYTEHVYLKNTTVEEMLPAKRVDHFEDLLRGSK